MMSSADRECIQDEWHQNPAIKETSDLGSSCFIAFGDVQRNIDWLFLPETSIYGNSEIMMIVLSRTDNFGRRNVLRKTWMNMNNSEIMTEGRMKALFLVGIIPGDNKLKMMLLEEARVYGDMIVADLNDRYDELTFKIISLLIYATSKTPQVKLIGKVDEDVLFIPDQLTPLIDQRIININASSLYGEVLLYGGQVNHKKGRWFVSKSSFKCDKYPGYLPGPFYLATRSAAIKILSATKHRNLISVEDVFITGLLADDVGVERKNIPNMYMLPSTIISQQTTILAWHTSDNNEKYQELFEKRLVEQGLWKSNQ